MENIYPNQNEHWYLFLYNNLLFNYKDLGCRIFSLAGCFRKKLALMYGRV